MVGKCTQVCLMLVLCRLCLDNTVPDKRAIRIVGGAESVDGSSDILVTYMDFEKALAAAG
jgi:hypothetical protein